MGLLGTTCAVQATEAVQYTPFERVKVTDRFWKPKLTLNRQVTVPHNLRMCQQVGVVDNFAKAGGTKPGDYRGLPNGDAFLYKAVEAGAYALTQRHDAALDRKLDAIIRQIAGAQEEDGYLRTIKTLSLRGRGRPREKPRWSNLRGDLELYCSGHLFEAAVAHHRATGKGTLLNVALKNVDHVLSRFGPNKHRGVPGHEEIELSLMRLYDLTGEKQYRKLAQFFVDERGRADGHRLYGPFYQDHKPLIEQDEALGQAVRATYLYSGAADVAFHTGNADYIRALKRLWKDVVHRKMYINGGIGSKHENEGFGAPYDLPNRTAYTEICAAISFSMWAIRMFRLDQDAQYFDVAERTLYNNLLAGVSLTGDRYFYACPLESDGKYRFNRGWMPQNMKDVPFAEMSATRKEWFPCACCPPNLARYLPQIPGFVYAARGCDLYVNLFIGSEAEVSLAGGTVKVTQETDYPWDGTVKLTLTQVSATGAPRVIFLRIPGWAREKPVPGDLYRFTDSHDQGVTISVNGRSPEFAMVKGYAALSRQWQQGDTIEASFPMPVRRVISHLKVKKNQGKAALQRGPLLYCFEGADHNGRVLNLALTRRSRFTPRWRATFLGGIQVLEGTLSRGGSPLTATAIPYYVWSNRGAGEMVVWVPLQDH